MRDIKFRHAVPVAAWSALAPEATVGVIAKALIFNSHSDCIRDRLVALSIANRYVI
jgi:hypothetical protein